MSRADLDTVLPTRLHDLRVASGLSATDLDLRAGFYSGTTRRLERGKQRIFASHLYRVACATGVPIGYFFKLDKAASPAPPSSLTQHEAERFLDTYLRIQDPVLKKSLCDLVETLAEDCGGAKD